MGNPSPSWVSEFTRKYRSGSISQYILHGNINDYSPSTNGEKTEYLPLRDYVSNVLFAKADIVVFYDRSSGIRFRTREMLMDFTRSLQAFDEVNGTDFSKSIPRDPVRAFTLLEMHFRKRFMDTPKRSIAFIMEYAETLIPMGTSYTPEDRTIQVYLQRWANEDIFRDNDLAIVLFTENLVNLNSQYVRNPFVYEIIIPHPGNDERLNFIKNYFSKYPGAESNFEMDVESLARNTAGLSLILLRILVAEVIENKIKFTQAELLKKKKELIEGEGGGLLEFVESKFNLSNVAGHKWAKSRLVEAATALKNGRGDVLPMGYLVNGPVGTGKTFLITCFANDIGVPMVILKNFRSKWQGETEGNLEKVLNILTAMAPVAVMIDEADAYLGDRNQEGDSGVSSRVFSMIASFMSNTDHRGKIIWFLLTARPDLMPVDLKRQGRAEEHIALFYPETIEEKKEMFDVMLGKAKIGNVKSASFPDDFFKSMPVFSGAEMEAAFTRAKFKAATNGLQEVSIEIIQDAINDFIPPSYKDEIDLMNYAAVLECTSKQLLPEKLRK